jgi:hypothetical protein
MAEIVNLRRVRKTRARVKAEEQAAANRVHFGRTKVEKQADRMEAARMTRDLEGAKRCRAEKPDDEVKKP